MEKCLAILLCISAIFFGYLFMTHDGQAVRTVVPHTADMTAVGASAASPSLDIVRTQKNVR